MKVTYNWLKEFVEIKISPKVLAKKLTMAGLEVTSLEEKDRDVVFEIEVTSNRPDCLSVIGVAREVAAITGRKPRLPQATSHKLQAKIKSLQPFSIKIEDKKDCPLYTAKIIKGIKVGPSPAWLKKRLELVGCRSVNNIVDITNYILFEWGEPLHAFDLGRLNQDAIFVRRAKIGERITTIDNEQMILNPKILVIADKEKPVAIAGVMGGKDTEVTEGTKDILLEAAVFNPLIVRRGGRNLGIQSDSSYRFERGIDLEIVEKASRQATNLILELAGGKCVLATKSLGPTRARKKIVHLEISNVDRILGVDIKATKVKKILNSLGFNVKSKTKDIFAVRIPSFRQDISLAIDLVEEVARIIGYERIPTSLSAIKPHVTTCTTRDLVSLIKNILTGLGLNEVITYSLIDKELLKEFDLGQNVSPIEISNPLSKEQEILRPTIIPSLSQVIACNLNQQQSYINIFEVAKIFSGTGNKPKEELVLGIALCGIKSWFVFGQGLIKESLGPLHLKGVLEVTFQWLGIKDYNFTMMDNNQIAIYLGQEKIGIILGLSKNTLDNLDIKNKDVWVTELSLDRLLSFVNLKKRFVSLPIYPGIARDISFIMKEHISIDDILKEIRKKGKPLLQEVKVIDYYKGKQIPVDFKGLTISCLYRSDERTLTEAEVNLLHSDISLLLVEKFSVQIRA